MCTDTLFTTPAIVDMVQSYSREELLSLRSSALVYSRDHSLPDFCRPLIKPRRGCRAGAHAQARRREPILNARVSEEIPTVITDRSQCCRRKQPQNNRGLKKVLTRIKRHSALPTSDNVLITPTLYVFNAAAITKPHAIEQLSTELAGYCIDVAVITETHLKKKHVNERFSIDGYDLFRRDRLGRRGGGVAIYARHDLLATEWTFQVPPEPLFELLWIKISARQRDFFHWSAVSSTKSAVSVIQIA